MHSVSSVSIGSDAKHYKMRQLINAIQQYFETKREDTAVTINMLLQSLSLTIDLSLFDPHSTTAPQFFVSLYELMNKMDQGSTFSWNCVDLLTNVSKNPSARHALIHTYKFVPSLSRLVSNQLSNEKKVCLLRLMQDLTCGIKISWQIPHLPYLMITLSQWIEHSNEEIATLCVGILVNLCYKNLPAIYSFMGNVDAKKITTICAAMRGPTIEIHTVKLLIVLDYMNQEIPENILLKLVNVTFESVKEAFRKRDSILLRQIIEFFLDVASQNSLEKLMNRQCYERPITALLNLLQNNQSMETGDPGVEIRDPECISVVFAFLNFFIKIKLSTMVDLYEPLLRLALKWIHTDLVSSQALAVLKSISVNVEKTDFTILEPLVQGLPVFLAVIECNRGEESVDYVGHNLKMAGLFQLLRIMAQVPGIRPKILEDLKVASVCKVLGCLMDHNPTGDYTKKDFDMANVETINLYIHGIALVNELARHDAAWMSLQTKLMLERQTHMILAQSLCQSPAEEKSIVFEMTSIPTFPRKMVADVMVTLQAVNSSDLKRSSSTSIHSQELNFPVLSVTQINKVDCLLAKLRESFAQKQFTSVLTSDVIELYEYKLAARGNAERLAVASLEAASERCTQLQHHNAQITAELNRSHQMLLRVQQSHEQVTRLKDSLETKVDTLSRQVDMNRGKLKVLKNQLEVKEGEVNEYKTELERMTEKCDKIGESKKEVEQQNTQLKQVVKNLEDKSTKLEKVLQKREDVMKKMEYSLEGLNLRVAELEHNLCKKQEELQQTVLDLQTMTKERNNKQQMLDTIQQFMQNPQEK